MISCIPRFVCSLSYFNTLSLLSDRRKNGFSALNQIDNNAKNVEPARRYGRTCCAQLLIMTFRAVNNKKTNLNKRGCRLGGGKFNWKMLESNSIPPSPSASPSRRTREFNQRKRGIPCMFRNNHIHSNLFS